VLCYVPRCTKHIYQYFEFLEICSPSNVRVLLALHNSMLMSVIFWKVAINWWLHQYFESVVSMYEDRFELYVLSRKKCEKTADNQAEETNWWRVAFGKPAVPILVNYVNISPYSLPARRTKELRALTGWYAQPLPNLKYIFHCFRDGKILSISLAYTGCP
jgi:hypothetical protein